MNKKIVRLLVYAIIMTMSVFTFSAYGNDVKASTAKAESKEFKGHKGPIKKVKSIDSLADAVSQSDPGDTIIVENGTYTDKMLVISGNGLENDNIIIKAETPGGVIITGKSQLKVKDSSYLVIQDFTFNEVLHDNTEDDESRRVLPVENSHHIVIRNNLFSKCGDINHGFRQIILLQNGASYNTIERNTFDGSRGVSVQVMALNDLENAYNVIRYNHFKNVPRVQDFGFTNGFECILPGPCARTNGVDDNLRAKASHTTVEYNLFENIIGDGGEGVSNKSEFNIYRYNTFRDSEARLSLRMGDNCIVDSNFFINNKGALAVSGDNHIITNNYLQDINTLPAFIFYNSQLVSGVSSRKATANTRLSNNTVINAPLGVRFGEQPKKAPDFPNNIRIDNMLIVMEGAGSAAITNSLNEAHDLSFTNIFEDLRNGAVPGITGEGIIPVEASLEQDGEIYRVKAVNTFDNTVAKPAVIGADGIFEGRGSKKPLTAADVGCDFN